jgi:hypothetical protein
MSADPVVTNPGLARLFEVDIQAGEARWLDAEEHIGENIGDTDSG